MTTAALAPELAIAAAFATAGLVFGWIYFAALRRTVELLSTRTGSGPSRFVPAALTLARIAGAMLFLGFAARLGALPLLAAFLGFLVARSLSLRAVRRTA